MLVIGHAKRDVTVTVKRKMVPGFFSSGTTGFAVRAVLFSNARRHLFMACPQEKYFSTVKMPFYTGDRESLHDKALYFPCFMSFEDGPYFLLHTFQSQSVGLTPR